MLTKEERAKIAERFASYDIDTLRYTDIYTCLFGKYPTGSFSVDQLDKAIVDRLIDLCDTSNMIELPLDKDGEVIHVGDLLYCGSSAAYKVKKIIHNGNDWEIQFFDEKLFISVYSDADTLTHKKPVTIKSLVKKLTDIVAADYGTPMVVKRKLSDIADQLESLGDNNE